MINSPWLFDVQDEILPMLYVYIYSYDYIIWDYKKILYVIEQL